MRRVVKLTAFTMLTTAISLYGADLAACIACHGERFEKAAMGTSKIVKDMSKDDIIKALKGYKNDTYGGSMKDLMKSQVVDLSDADIDAMSESIKNIASKPIASKKETLQESNVIDINKESSDLNRIKDEDLGNKSSIKEEMLGLRKTSIYTEKDTQGDKTDYNRPSPGSSKKFERAFVNAPPMIPHSVDGLLPVTKENNQCVVCHMPDVAKSMGATPIPKSHFTNYRPTTIMKGNEVIKEGKIVGKSLKNTTDIKFVAKHMKSMYQGRFNCTQCHAPQSMTNTVVANTFKPLFGNTKEKSTSTLADTIRQGVK